MSDKMIRVGIVGAGANTTSRHIPGLQSIDGVEIISVCNRSRASSERVAQQFNIPKIYGNWQELVQASDTDAIVIGTWPYMHCCLTLAALEADKHVMCEARMAMNAREAHMMYDVASMKPALVTQIVPSPFTLSVDSTIKRYIANGYLGEILAIEVRAGGQFLDSETSLHWRENFNLSGFNIMSMGIWYEAMMRWIGEATRVIAVGKTFVKMREDENGVMRSVRVPEHIGIIADMACGAQAHYQISSVTGLSGGSEAFLYGSQGTLHFSNGKLYGGTRNDSGLSEIDIPDEEKGSWRVEEEFINAIRGEEIITHTSFEDGVKYMEFTEAVTLSMMAGEAVSLPLLS
ncbi:TPA: Gfo/Idh/MocA family oxidoreductase [Candidatus Poribacteria bacterium]|jgi:predicted dehydrogenase|nr:Gfo/Idh/MocA family oxidoreductase [Candidatus Poribacteria bacterium]HIB89144.1 Gfo/Idh/MocA family oxidoreductase [Candidatus Poribacteria bacterium]HIC01660.1 Gfo/Idh/MocA family oxidoreductase [Candidatus Poribacteria bacterium]HIM09840.1 Gfo/Idh/MocA family oxidoreductase [Candidatus Poribacteria bacterium]HIN31709.1 Gfo/Idh/MocA family oxidoreductase [Candidatus Poribacteria bacterium]